ncbi:beta-galactosidase 17 isoform X2 [Gastrolobium bilobum]|uniref:beta-galactosidase 17 isoform X2 n=1 Tax=Gastrolobium bilobum TaxID=150636 RepID=UPI002AB2DBE8|nr:beta-galactosidase 17 isoform X2 [Gastrolobium bilobum]
MVKKRSSKATLLSIFISFIVFCALVPVFVSLPSLPSHHAHHSNHKKVNMKFEIDNDRFWKDGEPFQIIGGDLHYFRVHPEYWEDRLLKAKALGLNTIQTYVPWNLHEPTPGELVFEGFANIESFLNLCHKHGFLVMVRAGPYICGEWDWGGFPGWFASLNPSPKLRSTDPTFLQLVERWWGNLLPKFVPLLYDNGGPIIMVQIENEYGSYGDDKVYLHHLVTMARGHLGHDVILYTTDGETRELLEKGTIRGDAVFSAVDFGPGSDTWAIFKLQKEFNAPGKSPPLNTEFYTGWLTHWGEKFARTDAELTAAALEEILRKNGSAVLYMGHGGTNFGFYNGANTHADEADYQPDLTSYDYDAPITEAGDVDNSKFNAIRRVIARYSSVPLPSVPPSNGKTSYGSIHLQRKAFLFDMFDFTSSTNVFESENPMSMEYVGQLHDRAQVFISCPSEESDSRPTYVGTLERWSNNKLSLPEFKCHSNINLLILVENMGRVNYGPFIFDSKGILSSVYLDGKSVHGWKMYPVPLHNLNEVQTYNPIKKAAYSAFNEVSASTKRLVYKSENTSTEPAFYSGDFFIDKSSQIKDTFISFKNWGKGIAFVNDFNLGRYWPLRGPQCNLYVPAPVLRQGDNFLVILELEHPDPELLVHTVDGSDFTCGYSQLNVHQM